ncbi:histone-arginine methyltransferase METTL23 [Takifugu rubripes]|uniref:Methyltransferase 23, arginine n=1 Tax=Takifugu rubripes TaxID=31033 RepID=H2RPB6_TAKRU|nr:methyltransferase-like protein 23 [Takifugu rubripes]|eukprot:XP_003976466.1 PREDICTED: methyltransferase-like protein 23 [Takifugu rubripes]
MAGGGEANVANRVFTFEEADRSPEESLTVSIPEVLEPQYGMYVWPCAVVLAQYLWTQREQLRGRAVLELGAGVALPGVVAARCGSKVILSDLAEAPSCLENCRRSCRANGVQDVVVLGLTWGDLSPDLVLLPKLDIILGSDVFYDPEDFEDVFFSVAFLLRKNPKAQFWTTYQERSADWSVDELLRRWNLSCANIPLDSFGADKPDLARSALPGRHHIRMTVVTLGRAEEGTS